MPGVVAEAEESTSKSIAAVERAMDVLLLLGRSGRPDMGVTEIAQELGITKGAVHRILTALRSRRLVTADPTTRRYALGPAAVALGRAYLARTDLRMLAAPELRALASECDETATLSVRRGDTRLYVDQVLPASELRIEVSLGTPYPLHAGASSKAILAFLPDDEIDAYLAQSRLAALTERTVTNAAALRKEIGLIRKRGYATSVGERQEGTAAVAAPVLDHDGCVIGVISLAGPQFRFRQAVAERAARVTEAAARVSAEFGHGLGDAD
ncbi:IclR family transcriptional regulator [Yinghuangia sp. YIM S09857]|uniref:IclR family transcriptional regulator n=1 Tax=Yinghuangia sp. YIM S09857 TaxID=3436929 RepID=UPI003F52F2CE